MDWEAFYREADYDRRAYLAGDGMAEFAARYVDRFGPFDSFASVGCGPAVVPFALADAFPGMDVWGFDVSETVVRDDRERAADVGLDNLQFAVDALPDLGTHRQFDVVYSVATLYFVRDAEAAVRSLYDRVAPGGHLVVNYANRALQSHVDAEFEGRKRDAFGLVLDGENLLTADEIGELLDAEPHDYWTLVDAVGHESLGPDTPCVSVEK